VVPVAYTYLAKFKKAERIRTDDADHEIATKHAYE
jgi:hypothetical protein